MIDGRRQHQAKQNLPSRKACTNNLPMKFMTVFLRFFILRLTQSSVLLSLRERKIPLAERGVHSIHGFFFSRDMNSMLAHGNFQTDEGVLGLAQLLGDLKQFVDFRFERRRALCWRSSWLRQGGLFASATPLLTMANRCRDELKIGFPSPSLLSLEPVSSLAHS